MSIHALHLRNTTAIGLLSSGQFNAAIAELKGALSSVKNALNSCEPAPDQDVQLANVETKVMRYALTPTLVQHARYTSEYHIVPIFNKVFDIDGSFDDRNLLAAVLLYNLAVAYSMEQHECSESTHIIKLYRFSLQILHDSGLMWNLRTNLLLMALYNNIAHVAFCDHLVQYAEEALRELSLLLVGSINSGHKGEDFQFFEANTLVWANEISLFTSPAA